MNLIAKLDETKRGRTVVRMGLILSILVLVLATFGILYMNRGIQLETFEWDTVLAAYSAQPLLFVLNGLPILLVALLLWFVTGNLLYGLGITSALFNILNLVNLVKTENRDDPFVPDDIIMAKEGMEAAGSYSLDLHPPIIAAIVIVLLAFLVLGFFIKSWRPSPDKAHVVTRAVGAVAAVIAIIVCMNTIYSSEDIYKNRVYCRNYWNFSVVFEQLGFNYSFLYFYDLNSISRPDGYSASEVEQWISDYESGVSTGADSASADATSGTTSTGSATSSGASASEDASVKPNVLFVMVESYSDLSEEDAFEYGPDNDPMAGWKQVTAQDNALVTGHLTCTNIGGGTANTEFDAGTGMLTTLISDTNPTAFWTIHREIDSFHRLMGSIGYQTWFMHPGYSWFYNRVNVYDYLGVDDVSFNTDFNDADKLGGWITDEAFLRHLEQRYIIASATSDAPFYAYTVTSQNHQQYTYDKYTYGGVMEHYDPVPLNVPVSDTTMEALCVYMRGVNDSSTMLVELTEFLNDSDEPTVLVFFGDHRPNIGIENAGYRELGTGISYDDSAEGTIKTFSAPYTIWANDAMLATMDPAQVVASLDLPQDNLISANHLGSLVYEICGMQGTDPYYDFLCELRRVVPVFNHGWYRLADGTYTQELEGEAAELWAKMRSWEYYTLVDEQVE